MTAKRECQWLWQDFEFRYLHGTVLASVHPGGISVAGETLDFEYSSTPLKFRAGASFSGGEEFSLRQASFSVSRLEAQCGNRSYALLRRGAFDRGRVITAEVGDVLATTPLTPRTLAVEELPGEAAGIPLADIVFMTWCCVLVDNPGTFTRS